MATAIESVSSLIPWSREFWRISAFEVVAKSIKASNHEGHEEHK